MTKTESIATLSVLLVRKYPEMSAHTAAHLSVVLASLAN